MLDVMQGTYFHEDSARDLCKKVSPQKLAEFVQNSKISDIAKVAGLSESWAGEIVSQFQRLENFHRLESTWKPASPFFKILTKGSPSRQLSINQLSDGQKHTILLTVAMLAESNIPLLIDQPEDDLDNKFIFKTIVSTLRSIKERRQVIAVTHNANLAVLGDSELIFPMERSGDKGNAVEPGSIDRQETKDKVQDILEGGKLAFKRRKEIYGH